MFREAVAAVIINVGKEDTHTNPANAFTKLMPYIKKQVLFGGIILESLIWGFVGEFYLVKTHRVRLNPHIVAQNELCSLKMLQYR